MKRIIFAGFILLFLLILVTGNAFAAQQPPAKALMLLEIRTNANGGILFVFRVEGWFTKAELNSGVVKVQGGYIYNLYCNQVDEETVICSSANKQVSGQEVVITFGGARFWARVPVAQKLICYAVYDWEYTDEDWGGDFENPDAPTAWQYQGRHCQVETATAGEDIDFYSPYWQDFYLYYFFPNGISGFPSELMIPWGNPGQGYYYLLE
jgi:hypothetical protein